MNFADPTDEATARQQIDIDIALAKRKMPEPLSAVCKNAECAEPPRLGTSYCCAEYRKDADKWARATQQRAHV